MIYEDDNSVIPYGADQWNKIGFPINAKVSLVAVLPKNELAVITSDEIQRQLRGASHSILFATKLFLFLGIIILIIRVLFLVLPNFLYIFLIKRINRYRYNYKL